MRSIKRWIATLLILPFINGMAMPFVSASDVIALMSQPGTMVHLSAKYEPALMVGLQLDAKDPFRFNFLMERGQKELAADTKREEYRKLIKYFLASLTIPNKDMWVNLSPFEHERIIPDNFGLTEMGRDLLAQDYLLKQITASLIHPEQGEGKDFWKKVYAKAYEIYGTTDIPLDTFNKVWIMPDTATIYHKYDTALIVENHLKVMMEQDYLALEKNQGRVTGIAAPEGSKSETAQLAAEVMREIVIPMIEKEVNEGEHFAPLRQVYSAMLMATWFKKSLKESLLGQIYADKNKVVGVELNDPTQKEQIYQKYLQAYKVGVFDLIKEEADAFTQEVIPRKYFSGGTKSYDYAAVTEVDSAEKLTPVQRGLLGRFFRDAMDKVKTVFAKVRKQSASEPMPGEVASADLDKVAAPADQWQGRRQQELLDLNIAPEKGVINLLETALASGRSSIDMFGIKLVVETGRDGEGAYVNIRGDDVNIRRLKILPERLINGWDFFPTTVIRGQEKLQPLVDIYRNVIAKERIARPKLEESQLKRTMNSVVRALPSFGAWDTPELRSKLLEDPDVFKLVLGVNGFFKGNDPNAGSLNLRVQEYQMNHTVAFFGGRDEERDKEAFQAILEHGFDLSLATISWGKAIYAWRGKSDKPRRINFNFKGTVAEKLTSVRVYKYYLEPFLVERRLDALFRGATIEEAKGFLFNWMMLINGVDAIDNGGYLAIYNPDNSITGISGDYSEMKKGDELDGRSESGLDNAVAAIEPQWGDRIVRDMGDPAALKKGGIDLDESSLNMKIQRDGAGMPLPLPRQDPALMRIEGLSPNILEVTPANSMPIFSELKGEMAGLAA